MKIQKIMLFEKVDLEEFFVFGKNSEKKIKRPKNKKIHNTKNNN